MKGYNLVKGVGFYGYYREKRERVVLGRIRVDVIFRFDNAAFVPLLTERKREFRESTPGMSNEDALNMFFSSKTFEEFFKAFKSSINAISHVYKGFPSALHTTNAFIITFTDDQTMSCVVPPPSHFKDYPIRTTTGKLFDIVLIDVGIDSLTKSSMPAIIRHELYHVISQFHEGEAEHTKLLSGWERLILKKVKENKAHVESWMKDLEKELGTTNLDIFVDLDYFYKHREVMGYEFTNIYRNKIADTALSIIAMELDDIEYVKDTTEYHAKRTREEESLFLVLQGYTNKIKKSKVDSRKKDYLLQIMTLLQFIRAFNSMPFNVVPIAVHDTYFHPRTLFEKAFGSKYHREAKRQIDNFENLLNKTLPETRKRFFRFWDQYKKTVKAMDIKFDPAHLDVKKQIHKAETIDEAERGFRILNKEFQAMVDEIHEKDRIMHEDLQKAA